MDLFSGPLCSIIVIISTEESTHVDILDLFFLLFLLFLLFGSGSWTGSTSGTSWGGGDNVGKEFIDLGTLEGLGEKEWPVWLYIISRLLDDRSQFGGL